MGLLLAALALPATVQAQGTWDHPRVEDLAWPDLQRFEDERAYREWVRDVRRMRRRLADDQRAALPPEIVVAQAQVEVEAEPCNPLFAECEDEGGVVVVTGSRVASSPQSSPMAVTSITNNQTATVDEGDIVKLIGDYLLVLQDGRIFAANYHTMQLTDRIDVYRRGEDGDPIGADWYDEMLVQGDNILVTAYSYYDEASELSVFRLDRATGKIERRGVFLISSEDYYDVDNYATRVAGDKLVIYTPFEPEDLVNRRNRPVVRRWVPEEEFEDTARGSPILEARDIYRPVFGSYEPMVHTISICDLGKLDEENLDCVSTGFIAGAVAEMFVSPDNIFLATSAATYDDLDPYDVCRARRAGVPSVDGSPPGAVFRISLRRSADVDLLPVRGMVFDQFSMDQQGSRFRMLESWPDFECGEGSRDYDAFHANPELIDSSIATFSERYRSAPDRRFVSLPSPGEGEFENRFVGDWLLYGVRSNYGRPPYDAKELAAASQGGVFAVPLGEPSATTRIPLGHEITRIEALAGDAVLTGYRDQEGLYLSYLDLEEAARVKGQAFLEGRYESESRSHAFNSTIYPEMDGLMGIPTVRREEDSGKLPWRSDDSGISFLRFTAEGDLADLSDIKPASGSDTVAQGYECEVSCIDWYGNARPIFLGRGVYALMGTELVEGRALDDRIEVLRRLDLTGRVSP
ncbi:beta-propeller domain-containing protein [Aurantiacibacter zhengii]|nr:beta-propeller domain-containing protein [Aurantiacibacter zhengii]